MSGTATPVSPDREPPTRTVAIIKNHALETRLSIERQILDWGFEVFIPSANSAKLS